MSRTIKVYCTGPDQDKLGKQYRLIEKYHGFALAEVPDQDVEQLSRRYPTEDITDLYAIRLEGQTIDTSQPPIGPQGKAMSRPASKGAKRLAPGKHHYLVQFVGPIKEEWLAAVKNAGGEPRAPYGDFNYVVRTDEKKLAQITALPFVRWAGHLPHSDRVDSSVLLSASGKSAGAAAVLPRRRIVDGTYTVEFFGPADLKAALPKVKNLGFKIAAQDAKAKVLVVEAMGTPAARRKRIEALTAVHGVKFIRERTLRRTSNNVAVGIMGTSISAGNPGLGLSGKGEIVAICDTGLDTGNPKAIHPDFAKRVAAIRSYPITSDLAQYINNPGGDDGPADVESGHGTHVAGSVLGSGAASSGLPGLPSSIHGLAYKARLVFQAVQQRMDWKNPAFATRYGRYLLAGIPLDLSDLFSYAYKKRARVHSNSWGGGDPGAYDSQCEQLDRFVWEHKDFCILFAAGNDGTDKDGDGKINPMSVTSPGTAKNCITVGACENRRPAFNSEKYGAWWPDDYPSAPFKNDPMADNPDQVVAFSSRGPTRDGRFKPDVIAPGTFILSTRSTQIAPNNKAWHAFPPSQLYFYMGGTSMATPLTAGAVVLLREYYRKKRKVKRPTAALLKATLVAGASWLPGNSPAGAVVDPNQGFGRVNLDAVLSPTAPASMRFAEIKPGLKTGDIQSIQIDVKSGDAPLRVTLAYSDFPGAALVNNLNLTVVAPDGTRTVGNQIAGGGMTFDKKNNVEVVHVAQPTPGAWKIEVVGSNVPQGPQDFALVYLGHFE
jgi:serine protease AprX